MTQDCELVSIIDDNQIVPVITDDKILIEIDDNQIVPVITDDKILIEIDDNQIVAEVMDSPLVITKANALPPDFLDGSEVFIFERGQTIIHGELILADSSDIILQHKASVILE